MSHDPYVLPSNLPVPQPAGQAAHLVGARLPKLSLSSTAGTAVSLQTLGRAPTVLFFYPRTGVPGQPPNRGHAGEDWDEIPGARGCTPQNCAFRDLHTDFAKRGVQIYGLSTQTPEFQRAFKDRNHVPFEYLSDADLKLVTALSLPTFDFPVESGGPNTLIERMSWFVFDGRIEKVWCPVFPPQDNAARVLDWLDAQLGLFLGIEKDGVVYRRERAVAVSELATVFESSGINRPHQDPARLATMLDHSNLVVTARVGGVLAGIARSLTDFAWSCYLSDLAVHADHQSAGIGRALIELSHQAAGPECALVLAAAPNAEAYYPRIGLERIPAAFRRPRSR